MSMYASKLHSVVVEQRLNYLAYGIAVAVDAIITASLCVRVAEYKKRSISKYVSP